MSSSTTADDRIPQAYLPDFCAAGTILIILLVAELVAILLTLVSFESGTFLTELSKMSMFVLWMALLGAGVLCLIRPWAERQGNMRAFVICFVVLELMILVELCRGRQVADQIRRFVIHRVPDEARPRGNAYFREL